ncbi:MAG: S-layer homology domain-containing protein [Clostridia bacterium]|nr:S-layer homology domain-containing protein [Clostridia bacterium]
MKKVTALLAALLIVITALPLFAADDAYVAGFRDVTENKWYAEAVAYVAENKLMTGTSETTFDPSATLTRAMTVQILAQIAGADLTAYTQTPFTDVPAGKWYTSSVAWANESGIATGISDDTFGYKNPVTREQLALMICKFAEKYDVYNEFPTTTENADGFADADKIHDWAKEGVDWAVSCGMISGVGNGNLDPRGTATRARAAQIFYNLDFLNKHTYLPPDTTDADAVTVEQNDRTRVVIWGNSMSQGYDDQLSTILPEGILLRSYASGGDTSQHIAMKIGGTPLYVAPFTIPAEKKTVQINLLDENLKPVESLADLGNAGLSPAYICGIKGFVTNNGNDEYFFTRNDNPPYEEVKVDRLTRVVTKGMTDLKSGDIHVIYSGAYSMTPEQYVKLLQDTIDFSQSDKYLIIGFIAPDSGALYDGLVENFGDNFLDIKTYFLNDAMAEAGLEPTEEDLEDIADGRLPASLRRDDVHGNEIYDRLLARLVIDKLEALGYID